MKFLLQTQASRDVLWAGEKKLIPHAVQFSTLVAATRLPYLPSGQPEQVNTTSLEYVPAGHAKHVDTELEPAVDDVPAGHAVHSDSTLVGTTRLPYLP